MSKYLPKHRELVPEQLAQIRLLRAAGIRSSNICSVLREQGLANSFIDKDVYNYITQLGGEVSKEGDAMNLLAALKERADADPCFIYRFTVDQSGRLEHLFWMFPASADNYRRYHNVVVFDTTYKINRFLHQMLLRRPRHLPHLHPLFWRSTPAKIGITS